MNKEFILEKLSNAKTQQEVYLLWRAWIRISNGTIEFTNRIPQHLKGDWE